MNEVKDELTTDSSSAVDPPRHGDFFNIDVSVQGDPRTIECVCGCGRRWVCEEVE